MFIFSDRREAGRKLAASLKCQTRDRPLVLALPRGGVPVAFEVARMLGAPLELLFIHKIGAPDQPEFAIGAMVDGNEPQLVLNEHATLHLPSGYLAAAQKEGLAEIARRRRDYLGARPQSAVRGRNVIIVDDGIATGTSVRAAIRAVRAGGAKSVTLAVPVAPSGVLAALQREADDIVCLASPEPFGAVGLYYVEFEQTTDEEVTTLLEASAGGSTA